MPESDYKQSLIEALKKMSLTQFTVDEGGKYRIQNERSFAYELYRQWMDTKPDGLVVNAEICKCITGDYKKNAKRLFGKKTGRFYPDMVLHKSQVDGDEQAVICEIKMGKGLTSKMFCRDVKKLIVYTTDGALLYHPFSLGVFILVGKKLEYIKKIVKDKEKMFLAKSKVLCISANIERDNIVIEDKLINEILNQ